MLSSQISLRERRLCRRMEARGENGLAEALCQLNGVTFGKRFRFAELYAIGGEGAVFLVTDLENPQAPPRVGKVPLHPVHRPFELTAAGIRDRRHSARQEAVLLSKSASPHMPAADGAFSFENPALPAGRGGPFAEAEPVMVMEKLPGLDLDRWLARAHKSSAPREVLRQTLDQVAIVLLRAMTDLAERGFFYTDLRPGNLRMVRRPERHIRLLDAGSIVCADEAGERFPHVPAYLPPDLFHDQSGETIVATHPVLAVMAGRSLYEIATGRPPFPGEQVDLGELAAGVLSPIVLDVVRGLCLGEFGDTRTALEVLEASDQLAVPETLPQITGAPVHEGRNVVSSAVAMAATSADHDAAPPPQQRLDGPGGWAMPDFMNAGDVDMSTEPSEEDAAGRPAAAPAPAAPAAPPPLVHVPQFRMQSRPGGPRGLPVSGLQIGRPPASRVPRRRRRNWFRRLIARLRRL